MSGGFRCAHVARELDEPRYATASTVRRWLLVEQPGPWGVDAVLQSRMPSAAAHALVALGRRLRARVLLIRRHGGGASHGCTAFAAVTGVRSQWLESFAVDAPHDVLDLELDGLRHGQRVGGRPEVEPLLLVCTNGRHDTCCAEFGRPVAAALTAAFAERTWEVSHIGGDRFAGNVVVLPDGVYYGGLDADRAVAVAGAHLAGTIDMEAYRGRSAHPFVVQAAEWFLRRDRGLDGLDAVRWTGRQELPGDRWHITFDTADGAVTVEVAVSHEVRPRQLTCRPPPQLAHPPRFELVGLRPGGPADAMPDRPRTDR